MGLFIFVAIFNLLIWVEIDELIGLSMATLMFGLPPEPVFYCTLFSIVPGIILANAKMKEEGGPPGY